MMVFGMSIWNLSVVGYFSWAHLAMGYVPGLITAFLLDLLVAGPVVKGVAFKFWELYTSLHQPQYVVFSTIPKRRLPFGNRLYLIIDFCHEVVF